ncbi:MAG: DUF2997 domain-containing protein [Pirellulaceae bacterium]|nr:DUF2997 domain-containing protein [Pirellulaceae bacterium]
MRTIIFKIQRGGEIKIETSGFTGSSCQEATRRFEQALGVAGQATLKSEFFQTQHETSDLHQNN